MRGCPLARVTATLVDPVQVVFGHFAGMFTEFLSGAVPASAFTHELHRFALYYVYLGALHLFLPSSSRLLE